MKDFVKTTIVMGGMLALVLAVRVAAFAHLHGDTVNAESPAPSITAGNGCTAQQVNAPCVQPTESRS
jgi:hypothetical protein